MRYYFDTNIWIDLFEDRDEVGIMRSTSAEQLLKKIVSNKDKIVVSRIVISELLNYNLSIVDIISFLLPLESFISFVNEIGEFLGKAKDLSSKRKIPKGDAMHALVARKYNAVLVTRDHDFQRLRDIRIPHIPEELL